MTCLVWNCQGLGGSWTIRHLSDLVKRYNPPLVFLVETKCHSKKIESVKRRLNMYGIGVDSRGKGGGLALLWNKSSFVNLLSFLDSHIDTVIQLDEGEDSWRFTGFYGAPETSNRSASWNLLRCLSGLSTFPWVCAGDFNAILVDSEKKGAVITPPWQLRDFREALNDSGLFELVLKDSRYLG
ncbi:UNVERIFIED_CONTAM: hypothetical protein Slati_3683000 [Sesamum latifolium]|uniref:Endonuclease/exonuclease/phosphatase domain-containing protein n=1 Tax=Sesamum latifolium TaxID=2727402 RepID=A0AAW2U2F7_9LAMI